MYCLTENYFFGCFSLGNLMDFQQAICIAILKDKISFVYSNIVIFRQNLCVSLAHNIMIPTAAFTYIKINLK